MKFVLKSKKGALSLSINAIVVLIIAIVFLGLALAFTRNLIGSSSEKLLTGIENVDISNPAGPDNPITVDGTFSVKTDDNKPMKISFYNINGGGLSNVGPAITKCINSTGGTVTGSIPKIITSNTSVGGNSETRFQVLLDAQNVAVGSYICVINISSTTLQVPVTITS